MQQKRFAHTDIQVPNFDNYRKDFLKDPTIKSNDHVAEKSNFGYLVAAGMLSFNLFLIINIIIAVNF